MQEPQPQLAELLRTCVHPPSLLLQIVHIEFLDVKDQRKSSTKSLNGDSPNLSEETHRYAVKYILSDGEIMMQALLHRKLIGLRDVADVVVGDLLDIRHFAVKKSSRLGGQGHVAYLAIEDCHFLQQTRISKGAVNNEEDVVKAEGIRKRKRTNSHIDIATTEAGAGLHISTIDVADKAGPPPAKRPSLYHTSDHPLEEAALSTGDKQSRSGRTQQAVHKDARNTLRRSNFLPPASGQLHTRDQGEMGAKPSQKERPEEKDSHNILESTFGARQIIFDEEEDDFFEALPTDQTTVKQRRRALQKLNGNASFDSHISPMPGDPRQYNDQITPSEPPKLEVKLHDRITTAVIPDQILPPPLPLPKKSIRDGTLALSQTSTFYKPQPPPAVSSNPPLPPKVQTQPIPQPVTQPALLPSPPFHTLSSLRNPTASQNVPAKSYTLTTLAVISWTGTTTIHRPGSLFPPKRHLKIIDPSLATSRPPSRQLQARQAVRDPNPSSFKAQNSFQDAVTVAVYIDAANFKPESGTLVLFRGLVMQRLVNGDIILNAYGRLKEQRFEEAVNKGEEEKEGNVEQEQPSGNNDAGQANSNSHWYITDHAEIRTLGYGSRLDYYLEWWAEKQRLQQPPAQN